jgi:hypothetical protein
MKNLKSKFINGCDTDLITEIIEEQMIPRKLRFKEFHIRYQEKHKQKYGKELSINN